MILKPNVVFLYVIFYSLICFPFYQCLRMKYQITVELPSVKHYCFRLLNGSTAVGCQSNMLGNKGAVVVINELADLKREVANLPYGISNIIAVVNIHQFIRPLIDDLKNSDIVTGILLINTNIYRSISFSEDSVCPNELFCELFFYVFKL